MKQKTIILTLLMLLTLIFTVSPIGLNDVTLSTPVDGTWIQNSSKHTVFTFSWEDSSSSNTVGGANCTLYMKPDNESETISNYNTTFTPIYNEWTEFSDHSDYAVSYSSTFYVYNTTYTDISQYFIIGTGDNLHDMMLTLSEYNNTEVYINYTFTTGLKIQSHNYGNTTALNSTTTSLYMDKPFEENNTRYYWTIQCCNVSAFTPSCIYPASTRVLYQDLTSPSVSVVSTSFTNASWDNEDIRFEFQPSDTIYSWSSSTAPFTCYIVNSSGDILATGTTTNNTAINITYTSSPDMVYTGLYGVCRDESYNNASTNEYIVYIDETSPTGNYESHCPSDSSTVSRTDIYIDFNVTESNLSYISLNFYGTDYSIDGAWQPWDTTEDAGSGGSYAYDSDYTTFENSTNTTLTILINYTGFTGTDFQGVEQFEYEFQFNVTNSTAWINISIYDYSGGVWSEQFANTSTEGTIVNSSFTVSSVATYLNQTHPLQIRINLTNEDDYEGLAKFYESRVRFYIDRCTNSPPTHTCYYNFTSLSVGRNYNFSFFANDSATNSYSSSTRTFNIDNAYPGFKTISNWTKLNSTLTFSITINDTTPSTCEAKIYDKSDALASRVTGTLGTVGPDTACTGTFTHSNINMDGAFKIEYNVTDEGSQQNLSSNKTGVMTSLYTGWNLIAYSDVASNSSNICDEILYCSQVSWYNNSGKAFTTFSMSTPTVNGGTAIAAGDAIFVYVTSDSYLIVNDYLPSGGSVGENVTLSTGGWNAVGLLYDTNIDTIINATNYTSSTKNITWVSWYNASGSKYHSCKQDWGDCTGTDLSYDQVNITKGYAVWILTDNYVIINRTGLGG